VVRRSLALVTMAIVIAAGARAIGDDGDDEPEDDPIPPVRPVGDGVPLVVGGAVWQWREITAPRLDRQIGPVALAGLDVALGRRADLVAVTGPSLDPPKGWPVSLAGSRRGGAPFGAPNAAGACDCTTRLDGDTDRRVAVLYALTQFTIPTDAKDIRFLELRLRYRDGVVAWINGVEVARRAVDDPRGDRLAARQRGPEWEVFRVPVVPGLLRDTGNMLAVEVRPHGRTRAPSLDAQLVGRRRHGLARGPMVQRVGATSASIVVETELPVAAVLKWGTTPAQLDRSLKSPPGKRHVFALDGLALRAPVHYQVSAGDATSGVHKFHTAPGAGETLRVAVYGDVRGGHAIHRALTEAMRGEAPDLVLATGDLVLRGTDEGDWQRFFAVTADMMAHVPYYPTIGNHDLGKTGDDQRRAGDLFELPPGPADRPECCRWYSFDAGDVHFVMLDSNAYELASQREWLDKDLAAARAAKTRAIIVSTHDGPYSRGSHGGNQLAQKEYVPILVRHRVDLVLSGHDHLYQRGSIGGLDYIVSGGGGSSLYPVSCGVPGRRKCKVEDGMQFASSEHHYVAITIERGQIETCPRRADGSAIEPCARRKLLKK
jgi:hypothetical protein